MVKLSERSKQCSHKKYLCCTKMLTNRLMDRRNRQVDSNRSSNPWEGILKISIQGKPYIASSTKSFKKKCIRNINLDVNILYIQHNAQWIQIYYEVLSKKSTLYKWKMKYLKEDKYISIETKQRRKYQVF